MVYDTFIQDFIHEFAGALWDKDIKDTMHKQMNLGGQSVRDFARHNALNNFYLTLSDNPEYQQLRETDLRDLLLRCLPAASQNAIRMAPNPALVSKVDDIVNYIEKGNLPGARAHSTPDSGQTRTPSRARFDSRSGPQTGPSASSQLKAAPTREALPARPEPMDDFTGEHAALIARAQQAHEDGEPMFFFRNEMYSFDATSGDITHHSHVANGLAGRTW